ncbi:hypothetical protein SUGI_0017670 [Cryptomeria japonica]|uniref:copper transporter 6-like n=1 Tax=Cryptomeria japonica TaxID=3369 RepID=UPI002408AE6A|nr:copper transporter 6-like [Cryptomeria japonica]GLJ05405.1 hypothetical protein SUGI_0017670 [Cryptomeria japonica]
MDPKMGMPMQNSSSPDMGMNMTGMQMTFYWGKSMELMFPGWSPHTLAKYLLSLVALFALVFFHQALQYVRNRIVNLNHGSNNSKDLGTKSLGTSIAETSVFAVNAGTGYLLTLAVMSYNVGVFLVVIAGLSVGFFCFQSWKRFDAK